MRPDGPATVAPTVAIRFAARLPVWQQHAVRGRDRGSDEVRETWAYVLASESVCAAAGSWDAVKAGGQVFR
jgi:hypothetical protein